MRPIRPIGPRDLCLGRDCADRQPDEQHGADAERESEDVDLPDGVTQRHREEEGRDGLRCEEIPEHCHRQRALQPARRKMSRAGLHLRLGLAAGHGRACTRCPTFST